METISLIDRRETEDGTNYSRFYIDVTAEMRFLFGDIVTSARQMVYERDTDRPMPHWIKNTPEELAQFAAYQAVANRGHGRGIGVTTGMPVFITFVTGKTVRFHTSEWGGISIARRNMATS